MRNLCKTSGNFTEKKKKKTSKKNYKLKRLLSQTKKRKTSHSILKSVKWKGHWKLMISHNQLDLAQLPLLLLTPPLLRKTKLLQELCLKISFTFLVTLNQ